MQPEDVHWFPHPKCQRPHKMWSAKDKQATEYEVVDFIVALIGLTKPRVLVETGTYEGKTTEAMADAILGLNRDAEAHVYTYEMDAERAGAAAAVLPECVTVFASALQRESCPKGIDFAFLDSGMRTRQADMDIVWPNVRPGGIVLVHDASPDRPPGRVRPRQQNYSMFDIATPRGLLVFQKSWNA